MKRFLKELKEDKIIHYILIILAATISAIPLIKLRIYGTDDGYVHILRVMGVDQILKSGVFPPYLDTKYIRGFAYAINVFYPPIVTYGPLLFKLFCNHYYTCLKLYTFATIIISGFTMYKLVEDISEKRQIALISSIFYIFIPYRLATTFNRFAIGEFSSYMFLPLVFLGLHNLLNKDGKKHYYIAIGAVGLILSHTITTEYTAIFSLIYILLNLKKLRNKDIIKKIVINIIFILVISSFFLLPLLEYKLYGDYTIFSPKLMRSTSQDVSASGLKLIQFFKDIEPGGVSFKLGITFCILSLLGLFTYRKMDKKYKEPYLTFLIISIISVFMSTKYFPWIVMPNVFSTLQYAWRLLTFFEFAISILIAFNLDTLIIMICKSRKEFLQGLVLLCSLLLIIVTMTKIDYDYRYEDMKAFEDNEYEQWVKSQNIMSHLAINREYMPIKASHDGRDYIKSREMRVYILSGEATIKKENKDGLNLTFIIENASSETILELPYLYYPGYEIKLNNQKLQILESKYGFLSVQIPENIKRAEVTVKYKGTILEKVSYVISAISTILFITYIIYNKRKDKINERKTTGIKK